MAIEGKIAKIIDSRTVILSVGSENGVKDGIVFAVLDEGDEVKDPDTGESLGKWEIIKGQVMVTNTQEKMCTANPPPREATEESSGSSGWRPLSSVMMEISKGPQGGAEGVEELSVNTQDISGRPKLNPVAVGDRVKSMGQET